jgi:hypothetical protein
MKKCKTSKGKTKITTETTDQERCHIQKRMNMGGNPGGESLEKTATEREGVLLARGSTQKMSRTDKVLETVQSKWAQFLTCCRK